VLRQHGGQARHLAWIDLHTGLGPSGLGERIFACRDDAAALKRARDWWGGNGQTPVTSIYDGTSTSALLTGLMWCAAYEECPQAQYTGIAMEYGTVPITEVIDALRGDHWQHLHPEAPSELRAAIKQRMLAAFYVDTDEWKAQIVAQAGSPGAVTIATNMAGRGTDIQLGGNLEMRLQKWRQDLRNLAQEITPEMEAAEEARLKADIAVQKQKSLAAGGLFVLGTERHESRRIDNQLRGRSGRQGDPGLSRFYLSLDDDLMRIFGPDTMFAKMIRSNLEDGEALPPSKWLSKAIETAQKKVEARNYDIRKQVVEYDDVMNDQRKVIYEQRKDLMRTDDVSADISDMRHEVIDDLIDTYMPPKTYAEQWDTAGLQAAVLEGLGIDAPVTRATFPSNTIFFSTAC